jgi:hypothetical protein
MRLLALRLRSSSFARTITALTGYLRPRPDPSLEAILREAFAQFDRDLAMIPLPRCDRPHAAPVTPAEQACTQCGGRDGRGD